jgi:hypothetical protein
MARMFTDVPVSHPDLERLLEQARNLPPMTPEQVRQQRISFVYGQLMDCAPNVTREQVERAHDSIYGKPTKP